MNNVTIVNRINMVFEETRFDTLPDHGLCRGGYEAGMSVSSIQELIYDITTYMLTVQLRNENLNIWPNGFVSGFQMDIRAIGSIPRCPEDGLVMKT